MRIEVVGDESIGDQARTYAEYRLFAALSEAVGTNRVKKASLVLRRPKHRRHSPCVVCRVTVELFHGVIKVSAAGHHPYGAINRAVDRLRSTSSPARRRSARPDLLAAG